MKPSPITADLFTLAGQTAVVTGGGSGIGKAIALGLAQRGANVGIVDFAAEGAAETAARVAEMGVGSLAIAADVTDEDGMTSAVEKTVHALGPLSLAVNAAGIAQATPALELSAEQFERLYRINVIGLFRSCQAEARAMMASGGGSILNLASISGIVSHREMLQAHYNSSKAAVAHLTRSLATEWAAHSIRVNALSPGFTLTPMNARAEVASMREEISEKIPTGRFAEPEEMVGPAVFLLSNAASYCTGVDLVVDGGYTLL
ncbi:MULTISPECIES: glucose 1-dehydrogenase [unclassified Microbacterium]|uniref:glucose 1-dehydrogenase n=1 Tax=unclassified Microbacterium TaxID=2609290 RepID=UPI001E472933|nr:MULTISPECIES: glucose 1-dehydrogenase [unclassified Microbacterium]